MLSSSISFAQVKFEAKASKVIVGLNESILVQFVINEDEDSESFVPPEFTGFSILDGPKENIHNSWVNGKKAYKKTYIYYIASDKEGSFVIDEAKIKVDGQTFRSQPIEIKVIANTSHRETEYLNSALSKTIHLETIVSKNEMSLDESFTVSYKLYVSPDSGISSWELLNSPNYENFDVKNIEIQNIKVENEEFKGQNYRYVIFKKVELKPKKRGKLSIEPLTLNVVAEIATEKIDIFGGRIFKPVSKDFETNQVSVTVN